MWLVKLNAILTRDNLSIRGWQGDKICSFCSSPDCVEHLFFGCVMSRYCWSLVSIIVNADCRPGSFPQFWVWANKFMPSHKKFHMIGLAAICWAIWLTRNAISFERKKCRSPTWDYLFGCFLYRLLGRSSEPRRQDGAGVGSGSHEEHSSVFSTRRKPLQRMQGWFCFSSSSEGCGVSSFPAVLGFWLSML